MSEPYLILHKVRGEPAFDIAVRIDNKDDEEEIWIIPTSGHRAFPYDIWPLDRKVYPIPDDWPDHYQTSAAKVVKLDERQLLKDLEIDEGPQLQRRRLT